MTLGHEVLGIVGSVNATEEGVGLVDLEYLQWLAVMEYPF